MKLQPTPFEMIKNGNKVIEIRLNDEKRRLLHKGDEIEFQMVTNADNKVKTRILDTESFNSFKELFSTFNPALYGSTSKDEYVDMYKYYSHEDEKRYGVLAIKIELI